MILEKKFKEFAAFGALILIIIFVFSYMLFGITGIRLVFGLIFISIPFYLILNNFELNESEKTVFSLLMGLTLFSSLVYLLGLLISFRVAIVLTFVILIGIGMALRKYKKKKVQQ